MGLAKSHSRDITQLRWSRLVISRFDPLLVIQHDERKMTEDPGDGVWHTHMQLALLFHKRTQYVLPLGFGHVVICRHVSGVIHKFWENTQEKSRDRWLMMTRAGTKKTHRGAEVEVGHSCIKQQAIRLEAIASRFQRTKIGQSFLFSSLRCKSRLPKTKRSALFAWRCVKPCETIPVAGFRSSCFLRVCSVQGSCSPQLAFGSEALSRLDCSAGLRDSCQKNTLIP